MEDRQTHDAYRKKGFANRMGFGKAPALLIVDFINGFTDASTPLGGDFSPQLAVTDRLLQAFRGSHLPVVYTTVVYEADLRDAGMFIRKVPSLSILVRGSHMVEVDQRIRPAAGERVVEKKFASAFFGTDLDAYLRSLGVDTVVMTGCTTSGCIRSSAIDTMQSGYHCIVVRDGVGDRAEGTHEANLFDIEAKYGDVVMSREVLDYLTGLSTIGGLAGEARDDFQRWWSEPASAAKR